MSQPDDDDDDDARTMGLQTRIMQWIGDVNPHDLESVISGEGTLQNAGTLNSTDRSISEDDLRSSSPVFLAIQAMQQEQEDGLFVNPWQESTSSQPPAPGAPPPIPTEGASAQFASSRAIFLNTFYIMSLD